MRFLLLIIISKKLQKIKNLEKKKGKKEKKRVLSQLLFPFCQCFLVVASFLHHSFYFIGMWTSELSLFQRFGKQGNTLQNWSFIQKLLLECGWMCMPIKDQQLLGPCSVLKICSTGLLHLRYKLHGHLLIK